MRLNGEYHIHVIHSPMFDHEKRDQNISEFSKVPIELAVEWREIFYAIPTLKN